MRTHPAFSVGSRFEIVIEALAAGGDGVGRVDGHVVFVPRAVPGDRLLVEVARIAARHLHAVLVDVLVPAPDRREPVCAHFERCGGCAWQNVEPSAQREAKGRIVRDALERLGGIDVGAPIEVRSAGDFGWRSRARMHVARPRGSSPKVGWLRRGSHDVEPVGACPVLVPALQRALDEMNSGARVIPDAAAHVHLVAGDGDAVVVFDDVHGRPLDGREPRVTRTIAGAQVSVGARAFFQGNADLLKVLVDTALEGLERDRDGMALDLYCGSGLFSLPLAARFGRVLGVEGDARAVENARSNAAANGIANARFEHDDVGHYLQRARRVLQPSLVLLDPPRRGAGAEVVNAISALACTQVRYVSCDPATLARDLARFLDHGFGLDSIVALDMFPQTPHVECVAILRR